MIKPVIIWDYDGTLVNSGIKNLNVTRTIVQIILNEPPEHFPVLSSVETYIRTITAQPNWRKFYSDSFGMNEEQIDEAGRIWTEQQSLDKTDCPLLPGIAAALEELVEYKHGIVSQNSRKIISENLELKNMHHYFDEIIGYEEVGLREQKPNPMGLLTAIRKLTTNNEAVIYIGDQQTDIECASNAADYFSDNGSDQQIISIFVTNGEKYSPITPNPDFVVSRPSELPNIISQFK